MAFARGNPLFSLLFQLMIGWVCKPYGSHFFNNIYDKICSNLNHFLHNVSVYRPGVHEHACVMSYSETTHVTQGETSVSVQAQPRLHNEGILRDGLCLQLGCQGVLRIQGNKERDYLLWL